MHDDTLVKHQPEHLAVVSLGAFAQLLQLARQTVELLREECVLVFQAHLFRQQGLERLWGGLTLSASSRSGLGWRREGHS
jgi:hypothetical protein